MNKMRLKYDDSCSDELFIMPHSRKRIQIFKKIPCFINYAKITIFARTSTF